MKIASTNERKAISPIIATVLIIAATLIAFAAIGGYTFGIFGSASQTANVSITGVNLRATDFPASGVVGAVTCGPAANSYVTLTNTGTASTTITGETIQWAGASTPLAAPASCGISAAGAATATRSMLFASPQVLTTAAVSGGTFTLTVSMANGAVLTYQGTFQ